jgi:predicted CXXCH cytochrome family protein
MSVLSLYRACLKKSGFLKENKIFFCLCILLLISLFQKKLLCADKVRIKDSPHFFFEDRKAEIELVESQCEKCHIKIPELRGEEMSSLKEDYEEACFSCHQQIPQSCRLIINPKIYNILKIQMPDFPLPVFLGRVTCASCHWSHRLKGRDTRPFSLRKDYDVFKKQAEKVEPHKTGVFCFLCHEKEPRQKDQPLYLKYGNDTVRLCKECHDNKRARADNHPVGVIPSKEKSARIPEEFPLTDGKITCVTCHRLKCQGEKINPLFLRGGPYKNRIEVCFVCHLKEAYKKANPHIQVTEGGEIREDLCLYCHSVDTDEKGEKKFGFKFNAPFRLYCIGCHPVQVSRHPFGAHHTGRYIESVWKGLSMAQRTKISHDQSFKITPVSLSGQLMCASCHNPHDPRPGPKLRISDVNESCRQCHFQHYGEGPSIRSYSMSLQPGTSDMAPQEEDLLPFGYRASLRFFCIGCHPNKEKKHPYGVDHNGKFINRFWRYIPREIRVRLSKAETSKIIPFTTSGQITCFTCHDPHDGRKGKKLRLEERDLLCCLCHIDRSMIIESYKEQMEKKTP